MRQNRISPAILLLLVLTLIPPSSSCRKKSGEVPEKVSRSEEARPVKKRKPYENKPWVKVDMPYLIGRNYSSLAKNILLSQAGEVIMEEDLEGLRGVRIYFGRNTEVRVIKDKVYFIRYNFESPVSLRDALRMTGFPENLSNFLEASYELRLNNYWGFRRIRFFRYGKDSDRFKAVEGYKFIPQEIY